MAHTAYQTRWYGTPVCDVCVKGVLNKQSIQIPTRSLYLAQRCITWNFPWNRQDISWTTYNMGLCIWGKYFVGYKIYISLYWLHGNNVLQNCLCSVKLGDMLIDNHILGCLIYWSSFVNRHEQLQNNFEKESLLCVCYSMYVTLSTKIRMFAITCHLVGWSTPFDVVVLGDRRCKTIICSVCCSCC